MERDVVVTPKKETKYVSTSEERATKMMIIRRKN